MSVLDKLVAANVRVFAEKFDRLDVAWWHEVGKQSINEIIGSAYEAGRRDAMAHVIDVIDGDDGEGGWEQEADDDDSDGPGPVPSTWAERRNVNVESDN